MYIIKKITLNEIGGYQCSQIVNHTNKTIASALIMLENSARLFVQEERGREAGEQVKIIDIHDFNQVNEPSIDAILLYRLSSDSHKIHVYQRKTSLIKTTTWTWGTAETPISTFRRTDIFELEEYKKLTIDKNSCYVDNNVEIVLPIEMVTIGSSNIKIPKQMTVSPICDVINQLKNSPKFKARFSAVELSIQSSQTFIPIPPPLPPIHLIQLTK